MAGAILVEARVLAAVPVDDVRASLGRLLTLGDVVLLLGPEDRETALPTAVQSPMSIRSTSWPGIGAQPASDLHRKGSRQLDSRASARLMEIQTSVGAKWLIAADDSVATARACPGLGIVCIGPASGEHDPTRPDHRAHSLLEAARWIETRETFA